MRKLDGNFLRYGCACKADYLRVTDLSAQFNHRSWRIVSAVGAVCFLLQFLMSFSVEATSANTGFYALMTGVFVVSALLLNHVIRSESRLLKPLMYLDCAALLLFGLSIGVLFSPEYLAVTYHVLLICMSLFIADRPCRVALMDILSTVLFCTACAFLKTGGTRELDIWNGITFCAIAVIIGYYMAYTRTQQFLLTKDLELASTVDEMTGLANRKAYEAALRTCEKQEPRDLVYAALDVNGLKHANDTWGHDAGDTLIKGAADCIRQCFASHGEVFRVGGDEFIALFSADEAELNLLREHFRNTVNAWTDERLKRLSVSCGFASRAESPELTLTELAKLADARMYENKKRYYMEDGHDRRKK